MVAERHGAAPRGLKVLHVLDNLGMGGGEAWLMELLRRWRAAGGGAPQMDFLATGGRPGVFDDEARALGAKIHYLRYGRSNLSNFIPEFRRLLRAEGYDAIHDHADYASGWHFLMGAGVLPRVRVTHIHNPIYQAQHNYGVTAGRRYTAKLGKALVAQFATHITGTSRQAITEHGFDSDVFNGIPRSALYCGFDPQRFAGNRTAARKKVLGEFGWSEESRVILFTGRIDGSPELDHPQRHKNSAFAVEAVMECARRDPLARAIFAGPPSVATPVLEDRIADAGFADRIRFVGVRHDVPTLMLGADVLLFPSRGEGLGMVAVEAQAAGLPVIASTAVPRECVVIPELVRFMNVAEGAVAWAEALLSEAARPRQTAGPNAVVADSEFSIAASARALIAIYGSADKCAK